MSDKSLVTDREKTKDPLSFEVRIISNGQLNRDDRIIFVAMTAT